MMRRALFGFGLVAVAFLACNSAGLTKSPGGPGDTNPTSTSDAGSVDPAAWGDPLLTRQDGIVRLGHLNVRRFFDPTCNSGNCGSNGFEEQPSGTDFEARTAEISSGLARLEADVITLTEIESQECMDALQAKLKTIGLDYPVAYVSENNGPGNLNTAVLSRGKLGPVKSHNSDTFKQADGKTTTFTRDLPEVTISFGDAKLIVLPAHFRSKVDDIPARRLAEAVKAQEIMVATGSANAGVLVLLGGDLNDTPGSPPIDAMEKGGALVRVAKDLSPNAQGTFVFNGAQQALDHIFATKASYTSYVDNTAKVIRDGEGLGGSDHAGLVADFRLPAPE